MSELRLNKRRVISLILIICIFSSTGILTKYSSNVRSQAEKSIAKWNVSIDTTNNANNTLDLISDISPASYEITVSSLSEVNVDYSIVLTGVPEGLEVKIDDNSPVTPVDNAIVFSDDDYSFNAGELVKEHTHVLTFNDPISTNNDGTSLIQVDVVFTQVD